MNPYLLLFAELLISIVASLAVLHILYRPLVNVLDRVCPDEQAASFWLLYTRMMLMLAPLVLVLTVDLISNFSNPLDTLRLALVAALVGLLIGLLMIGKRLTQFIAASRQGA